MARYVAFLRGINLGSTNKVSMPRLREMAEGLGYTDVATYINSGNLVLRRPTPAALERELSAAIAESFGEAIDVTVRTPAQLADDRGRQPLPGRRSQPGHGGLPDQGGAGRGETASGRDGHRPGAVHLPGHGGLRVLLQRPRPEQAGGEGSARHRGQLDRAQRQHRDQGAGPVRESSELDQQVGGRRGLRTWPWRRSSADGEFRTRSWSAAARSGRPGAVATTACDCTPPAACPGCRGLRFRAASGSGWRAMTWWATWRPTRSASASGLSSGWR